MAGGCSIEWLPARNDAVFRAAHLAEHRDILGATPSPSRQLYKGSLACPLHAPGPLCWRPCCCFRLNNAPPAALASVQSGRKDEGLPVCRGWAAVAVAALSGCCRQCAVAHGSRFAEGVCCRASRCTRVVMPPESGCVRSKRPGHASGRPGPGETDLEDGGFRRGRRWGVALRRARVQFTGVTLTTRPPWRWIACWVSSILLKGTNRTVLLRLCRR